MKIPDVKAAVDKEWEKLGKIAAWQMIKVKKQKGGHPGSAEGAKNSSFCCADGHLSSQECGGPKTWDALNVNANRTKVLLMNTKRCSNHESLLEQLKNDLTGRNHTRKQSLGRNMEGHAKKCVGRHCELAPKRLSNCTTSLLHAWTTISSKRKNWKRFENCQKFALESS